MDWITKAQNRKDTLISDRRWLHSHAEVGFDLKQTFPYVWNRLTEMGYEPKQVGKAGISAELKGKADGKTLLLLADMDALPIQEESDVPFPCPNGAMHACGHDMHTAMLLGAAELLKDHGALNGTVRFMFQPAEEIFQGSADMIENGILADPRPDAAMMIHVTAAMPMPTGTVIVSAPGVSAPAADYFTIKVMGKGCHGSAPQNGVDALTAAAHIVIALQELHARELASTDEAVLTIGTCRAGSANNAIADSAVLGGTIRTYDETTRSFLKQRLEEISRGIAGAFRASAEVTFGSGCPTLVNDKAFSEAVYESVRTLLGDDRAISAAALGAGRGGGSEDFAYVSHEVPSVMLALAAGQPEKGYPYPQHHPKVKFDEDALPIGAAVFAQVAEQFLN